MRPRSWMATASDLDLLIPKKPTSPGRTRVSALHLEAVLQRELDQPRRSHDGGDLGERAWAFDIRCRWVGERRMVEEVEKVGSEAETLALGQLESLADGEV